MPTQAARVATWVPTVTAGPIGNGIQTTTAPAGAQAPIATQFGVPATVYATAVENQNGTLSGRSVDPVGLRTELVRLLGIPTGTMQTGDIVASTAAEADMLVKTDGTGKVNGALLPPAAMTFSSDAENQAGVIGGKALNPSGLRTELVRLLGIPTGPMGAGDIVASDAAEPGMLVKTLPSGLISQFLIPAVPAVVPDILDAGTF